MTRKYRKNITLEYQYQEGMESEQILEVIYGKVFSGIIQKQKQLREYFKSEDYKNLYAYLCKTKSLLLDFLQRIDKVK